MTQAYRTLRVARSDEGVVNVVIDAPPMNLIGPEVVRDFVALQGELTADEDARVMVLESADPEYFVPHVDLTRVAEYTAEAAKAGGAGRRIAGHALAQAQRAAGRNDREDPRPGPRCGQRTRTGL